MDSAYCYPDTNVLCNKRGLRDPQLLADFERKMTRDRMQEPLPTGHLDYEHLKAIHHHLFQDVYEWAGQSRVVDISKGGSLFCRAQFIDQESTRLMKELAAEQHLQGCSRPDDFAHRAAHYLCELNAIHPFREGNGRTQRAFLADLAERAGHPLDMTRFDERAMIDASIAGMHGQELPMAQVIFDALRQKLVQDQRQQHDDALLRRFGERRHTSGRNLGRFGGESD
jgi:cell filamentation protein